MLDIAIEPYQSEDGRNAMINKHRIGAERPSCQSIS